MAKTSKKKGNGKFLGPGRLWLLLGLGAVFVLIGLFAFVPYTGGDSQWLRFRTGALSTSAVRDTLCNKLGSNMGMRTYMLWRTMGGDTLHVRGAFRVKRGDTPFGLARRLATGSQTPVNITFNNVRTMDDLAARVASQMDFTPEDFLAATDSVLQPKGFKREEYPAMFLPDTYNVYATAKAPDVVNKLVGYRDKFWTAERIAAAEKQGLTAIEAATLASIVEEETSKRAEHPTIARLYLNRLHKGMRLQADPTVKFAMGDFAARRITLDMLKVESPYNTYLNAGLPPGPIRIADARTIETVLHPATNDYLYMCANYDFSGTHLFSNDYETHKRNARLYQQALDKRGIKK